MALVLRRDLSGLPIMNKFSRTSKSHTIKLENLSLHYLDWSGGNPPILLLHPNRTNARVWDFVVDASSLKNRYIAWDARGHGFSDYPTSGYDLDNYVADLVEFCEKLGLFEIVVVGAATGANIGLLIASEKPELVRGLVLADPGLSLDKEISNKVKAEITNSFQFKSFEHAKEAMPFSSNWSDEMREHYARHSFKRLEDGRFEWRYFPPGAKYTEAQLENDMWTRIKVVCPTLIMRGQQSIVFPLQNMEKLQGLIPGSDTHAIPGSDHRISQDQPKKMAALIDNFAQKLI